MQSNKPLHRICKWIPPSETISKRPLNMQMQCFLRRGVMSMLGA